MIRTGPLLAASAADWLGGGSRDGVQALAAALYGCVPAIAAGLHAVLELPGTDQERQVIARAAEHGLALTGLESHRADGRDPAAGGDRAGLVIGYGRPPEHAYTTALARLCAVVAQDDPRETAEK